mmetsp:Transcript_23534/g.57647  ORF Transcript_23534/g.57647 Transcript_23534/m.57647 type:complete len:588 (+) Transcript_23534:303-2066(+)
MTFKDYFNSILSEALTYKTVKLVKTTDRTLISLHLTFMTCITAFTFLSMVVFHNYMKFEVPTVNVSHRFVPTAYNAVAKNTTGLSYCLPDSVDYVGAGAPGLTFADPQCVTSLSPDEFIRREGHMNLWVLTHFRQSVVKRKCEGKNLETFVECVDTVNSTTDGFVVNPEMMNVEFQMSVMTSWGLNEAPEELVIAFPGGARKVYYPQKNGDHAMLSVAELLELADLDLDAQSPTAEGTAARFNVKRAPHRLMGVHLKVRLECRNTNPWRPFSTTLMANLEVKHVTSVRRLGPEKQIIYQGPQDVVSVQSHDEVRVERDWSGIYVEFEASGSVGETDAFQTILAITNAFVLIGMATFAVDFIGQMISTSFYDDKYEDDGERAGLESMLASMANPAHRNVPFDPKELRLLNDFDEPGMSYENAIYTLMQQVREMEDRLSMIPEEEAEFVGGSAPGKQPPGIPALRLVEELSEAQIIAGMEQCEVELFQGVQMMGRGVGNVGSKAVSRQQFTLTVVKDKVRMKALRDGPGYMKDDSGRFEPLKATKAVVLQAGDRVAFRMREGKQGGHLGIYRLDYEEPPTRGFFSILGC